MFLKGGGGNNLQETTLNFSTPRGHNISHSRHLSGGNEIHSELTFILMMQVIFLGNITKSQKLQKHYQPEPEVVGLQGLLPGPVESPPTLLPSVGLAMGLEGNDTLLAEAEGVLMLEAF